MTLRWHLCNTYRTSQELYMHMIPLQWRCNGCDSVSNHQPREYLLSRLIRRRSKKTSKLRVTGLCAGNSPVSGELPAQRASNAENVSIWWRHHVVLKCFVVVIYWSIYICLCLSQSNHMHVGKWITSITRILWHESYDGECLSQKVKFWTIYAH